MKKRKKHQRRKSKTSAGALRKRKRFKSKRRTGKKRSTAFKKKARRARVAKRKIARRATPRRKAKRRIIKKGTHRRAVTGRAKVGKIRVGRKKKRKSHPPKLVIGRVVAKRPAKKIPIPKPVLVLNTDFEFFYELRDLILKSSPAEKTKMIERLNKLGRIKLAIISGIFINKENLDPLISDILIVGDDIDRRKLRAFLRATEAEVGKEIKFAVMDKEEFQYRLAMFDRFTRVLLESPHEKLINRLGL